MFLWISLMFVANFAIFLRISLTFTENIDFLMDIRDFLPSSYHFMIFVDFRKQIIDFH